MKAVHQVLCSSSKGKTSFTNSRNHENKFGLQNGVIPSEPETQTTPRFYVFLTVHLSVILDNDQLDTQLLYFTILFYDPVHVSSIIYSSSGV